MRLEEGFLRLRCERCHPEKLVAFSCRKRGFCPSCGARRAKDLQEILERIAARIGKALERRGLVERDTEKAWLALDSEAGPMDDVLGHAITYRIAVGPGAGQKLFMLQTLPARRLEKDGVARTGGFTLHAGVCVAPGQHAKRERMCRYASRPPVAADCLALTPSGLVRYALKTPYRDGTTHIMLDPLDLMARLAALVPPPRSHLTRYHGVFAPRRLGMAVGLETSCFKVCGRVAGTVGSLAIQPAATGAYAKQPG